MGWFLTNRKKKKRTPKRKASSAGVMGKPWDPQRTLRGLQVLGAVAALGLVAWAWSYGEPRLRQYAIEAAMASEADRSDSIHVNLVDAPSWLAHGSHWREELVWLVRSQLSHNPLGATDLDEAVRALSSSAWVEKVHRIERVNMNQVRVTADYRMPAALIATPDGYHLVDTRGVRLLPETWGEEMRARTSYLPVIVGVDHVDPRGDAHRVVNINDGSSSAAAGETWPGDDVQAALALIGLIRDRVWFDQVVAIDVSRRDPRGRLRMRIRAANGGHIDWGFPPGQEQMSESSTAFKLTAIDRYYGHRGAIAPPGRVVQVFNHVIYEP